MILNTIQRVIMYILLSLLAGFAITTFWYKHKAGALDLKYINTSIELTGTNQKLSEVSDVLKLTQANLELANKTINDRDIAINKIKRAKEKSDVALKTAITASPVWSNQPVPDGVRWVLLNKEEQPGSPVAPKVSPASN